MEIHEDIKALRDQAQRIEDRMDKRLDRLEDLLNSKFTDVNKDIASFKKLAFGLIFTITGTVEAIKHKLGL